MRSWPVVGLMTGALVTASCSTSDEAVAEPFPVNGCDTFACAGDLEGASYEIQIPDEWNGTLLLWSHGYRQARPAPPGFEPVSTEAESAPTDEVAEALLGNGYALAGSAYRSNGWAVADAVEDQSTLYDFFVQNAGEPERVVVWGASLGGLITQTLAEQVDWADAAVPYCGVLGGTVDNFDVALDASVAFKALIDPQLKVTGYSSFEEAVAEWTRAVRALETSVGDLSEGPARIRTIAAMVDAPAQTQNQDGASLSSEIAAYGEALATALGYSTFVRYELEQRAGGNPSQNLDADYSLRVDLDEFSRIDSLSGGRAQELIDLVEAVPKVAADPGARARAAELGQPTGDLSVPTLAVHTAADPLVIVQNQTLFGDRVADNGDTDSLKQLVTVAPRSFTPPAEYGAGHCVFTTSEWVAGPVLMSQWLDTGTAPEDEAIRSAFGTNTGLNLEYTPPPWPGDGTQ